jgi:capsular exopolysaccharide synthesis family protein
MSRIQNILEKAEREGVAMRTGHLAPSPPPAAPAGPVEMPSSRLSDPPVPAVNANPVVAAPVAAPRSPGAPTSTLETSIASYTVRLDPMLVAGLATKSLAAEQYRSLRTRLAHAENGGALRIVLVTSPQKGEGKSVTAANLALTMAQELGRRVVIVEADLRKPSLQLLFGLPPGPGLAEYLTGAAELKDAMKFLPDHNLTVIPAGLAPTNPAELLGSTAMRRMIDHLRTRFDRVILDTPPVLPLADVAILAPLADGTLMVVRAGVTPKPAIENALRAFDASRLLGVVLNESGMEQNYRYETVAN